MRGQICLSINSYANENRTKIICFWNVQYQLHKLHGKSYKMTFDVKKTLLNNVVVFFHFPFMFFRAILQIMVSYN